MAPIAALALLALFVSVETVPRQRSDAHALAGFNARLDEYVEIHRFAAAGLVDPLLCADPEELDRQSATLAAAIRDARPTANEGDIFTVAGASALRVRIARAMRASKGGLAITASEDDELPLVHATIRAGAWDHRWAPVVDALPQLPSELEYQFVGRHLVLVDVRANLVVDVLRDAVPAPRPVVDIGPPDPCAVHPELPACWM